MSETSSAEKSSLKKTGKRKRKPFRLSALRKSKCNICSGHFSTIAVRNKHMLIHSEHKEYSCEVRNVFTIRTTDFHTCPDY